MKITSIEIHQQNSFDPIVLSFRDPKNFLPYIVQSITGLDATTLSSRVIAIKCGFNPEWVNYSELRDTLYKAISASRTGLVQVIFKNGTTVVAGISGYISKVESPQTDKNPTVTMTIQCDDPIIRALTPIFIPTVGVDLRNINVVDDLSTASHGFVFAVDFTANKPSLELSSPIDSSWSFIVTPSGGFLTGDKLYFSSIKGLRYVFVNRSGISILLADVVAPNSVWPELYPGNNQLIFSNGASLTLDYLGYYPSYWGI